MLKGTVVDAKAPKGRFDEIYRTAFAFLSNPWKLWASGKVEWQRLVVRLAFVDRLAYCRNEGYRTAAIAEPIRPFWRVLRHGVWNGGPGGIRTPDNAVMSGAF